MCTHGYHRDPHGPRTMIVSGADPGFFPRGGPVGHSATKTPQASEGKVRILNMKCSRSDSEQTSGTLEIFSRAIFLGTLLHFCENNWR